MMKWISLLCLSCLLAGCLFGPPEIMAWPSPKGGGLADMNETRHITHYKYVDINSQTYRNLRYRYFQLKERLDQLGKNGGHQCLPGMWILADRKSKLAIREITVGLFPDAAKHLKELEAQNKALAKKLMRIRSKKRCR